MKKRVEIFEFEKPLLLDNLRIYVGRSQSFDLCNDEVPNALNGLFKKLSASRGLGLSNRPCTSPTFCTNFSSSGPRSDEALTCCGSSAFLLCEVARRSSSVSNLGQDSSTWPVAIFVIISGDTLSSSTNGLSAFSTSFLFSSLLFRAVERSCNDSISAETVAKSLRKLVRFVSTELRISSQAVIERCRSSNLA